MLPPITIYDTTLRDGAQREGLTFSLEDKLRIARRLDDLGIPFIEGGWPGANPKDVQFFWELREQPLKSAEIVAFCSTRRPGQAAATDPLLQPILAAGTRWVTIFGKSWDLHVTEGLKTSLEENIAMIEDTITFLRSQGRRVIYDAEHWFDGYKHNPAYALQTLHAAHRAGAEWLVLCDTNGGTLPQELGSIVRAVQLGFGSEVGEAAAVRLGIHTHNDAGVAVANAIAAVLEGATMVQGTINGYGERCGNADLCSVIPNLQLKLQRACLPGSGLAQLTATSRFVSEVANLAPDDHAPFVGVSAFAHKGGIHVSAVARNPITYEHLDPTEIGNQRRIVISDQAGLSNLLAKAHQFGLGLEKDNPACRQILEHLKQLESQGYQFEAAEASFELLLRKALGQPLNFFEVLRFQIHCDYPGSYRTTPTSTPIQELAAQSIVQSTSALATVKVRFEDQERLEVAEGIGPVAALDQALRKALVQAYPALAQFHLTDYKVRILDSQSGTDAKTRVLVESSNGHRRWSTLGVSTNIIEASYQAVIEGLEYGLMLAYPVGAIACELVAP